MIRKASSLCVSVLLGCSMGSAQPTAKANVALEPSHEAAPDPTASDGDKYRVVLDNERVRVLRYDDLPGQRTHRHHHPNPFVMVPLEPFTRHLSFPDGRQMTRSFATGEALWMPEQIHIGENVGTVPTHVLLIEVKDCAAPQ